MFFLVPLSGDTIETKNGVKHTVLSYAPHTPEPGVYVDDSGTKPVSFSQIKAINGTPVSLSASGIFEAGAKVKRSVQLPQHFDKAVIGDHTMKITSLKLRDKKNLSKGMFVVGEDVNTGEKLTLRLADITRLKRAAGDEQFTYHNFAKLYADYLGGTT